MLDAFHSDQRSGLARDLDVLAGPNGEHTDRRARRADAEVLQARTGELTHAVGALPHAAREDESVQAAELATIAAMPPRSRCT